MELPCEILRTEILPRLSVLTQIEIGLTCRALMNQVKRCWTAAVKSKLAELFSPPNYELIRYLTEVGAIAGGSLVYALNNFVPATSVGDIDVYIRDPQVFIDTITGVYNRFAGTQLETISSVDYSGEDIELGRTSIVNVFLKDQRVNLQFILQDYNSLEDIVRDYDLDYVQSALNSTTLFTTDSCRRSHQARRVIEGYQPPNITRLRKATLKGFQAPVLGLFKKIKTVPIELRDLTPTSIDYFKPRPSIGKFLFQDLCMTKLTVGTSVPSAHPLNQLLANFDIGTETYTTQQFSMSIDILRIEDQYEGPYVIIQPLTIGGHSIATPRIDHPGIKLTPGRHTVIAQIRLLHTGLPSMKIVDTTANGDNYHMILPVQVSSRPPHRPLLIYTYIY